MDAFGISYGKAIVIPRHFFNSKDEELEIESFIKKIFVQKKQIKIRNKLSFKRRFEKLFQITYIPL